MLIHNEVVDGIYEHADGKNMQFIVGIILSPVKYFSQPQPMIT